MIKLRGALPGADLPWQARAAQRWFEHRTLSAEQGADAASLAARIRAAGLRVDVAIPALDEADTIGAICETIRRDLMEQHVVVHRLVVLDGGSRDDTAAVARAAGAEVVHVGTILPGIPQLPGKGESLWRSLALLDGDLVVWVDGDIRNFDARFVTRLVEPLVEDESISFVKGFYRRPLTVGDQLVPSGGGRVTELMARPLLNAFFPELAGFLQPLSGEYAGRREVLRRVPFFTGYGVEVGLLIDLLETVGLDALAQVDLDERVHRNRPLEQLGPMAYAIGQAIMRRAEEWGRLKATIDYPSHPLLVPGGDASITVTQPADAERPPMDAFAPTLELVRASAGLASLS